MLFKKNLKIPMEELKRRQLIALLPFQLLRLRKEIERKRTPENMEALKDLICHDIIGTITENIAAGNLSVSDGRKLKQITLQLYRHLYKDYKELEKAGVNDMVEDAMVLDIDIIEYEHQKEIEKITKELTEEKDGIINKMAAKLRSMGLSEEEISQMINQE